MAQKHKSKYKAPKDLEKSQKPKPRKDLKDYTHDDKDGKLNPKSTGEKQSNVLRKTDKEVVDDGKYDVKYNSDDRLYTDLEDGDYDPKHAAKVFKKRQEKDEKDNEKNIKDKVENLTREQKERLVREYIRKRIMKVLAEQTEPTDEPTEEPADAPVEEPTDAAAAEPTAEPTMDPAAATDAMPTDMAAPAPAPSPAPAPDATAAPAPATPDAAAQPGADLQPTPEELENRVITGMAAELEKEGAIGKIKAISKVLKMSMKETDPADQATLYRMLRQFAIKKLSTLPTQK